MSSLLVELLVEEIPARMQVKAVEDFSKLMTDGLDKAHIKYSNVQSCVSPRRIVFSADVSPAVEAFIEEKKGPQVTAPIQVIDKFLKANGISRADCVEKEIDKKRFVVAAINHEEQKTINLLPSIIKDAIVGIPWQKSMHWGDHLFYFVRPLRGIMAVFDDSLIDIEIKRIDLRSRNYTFGHHFLDPRKIEPKSFAEYRQKLWDSFVVADHRERRQIILDEIRRIERDNNIQVEVSPALLDEVVGLVEYPIVLLGKVPEKFMTLPEEAIITPMRVHQRYFPTHRDGKLAPYFVFVANNVTVDNGKTIIKGNERVLNARLADALFFFNTDLQKPLEDSIGRLKKIVFHESLGTIYDRIGRVSRVCDYLCDALGEQVTADSRKLLKRANVLAKCDLTSNMVCEFTELQGIMGGHYARIQGEAPEVWTAIRDQYKMADDQTEFISALLYIADRIELISGFFAIGKTPTGTKDPFALRRAAIGVVKIIRKFNMNIDLKTLVESTLNCFACPNKDETANRIIGFICDRLKVLLKNEDIAHDIVTSLIDKNSNVLMICRKAVTLNDFLQTDAGTKLHLCYKRARNIVGDNKITRIDEKLLQEKEEKELFSAVSDFNKDAKRADDVKTYLDMSVKMIPAVEAFFEKVLVNANDENLKQNRINLLTLFLDTSLVEQTHFRP